MFGKAQLKVKTSYSGSFADDIRSSFQNNSHYEMLKSFVTIMLISKRSKEIACILKMMRIVEFLQQRNSIVFLISGK
jgi:hypothetical protein